MNYSFIQARRKHLISQEMWLVIFFFGMTLLMLVATYLFLLYKSHNYITSIDNSKNEIVELKEVIEDLKIKVLFIQKEHHFAQEVYTENLVLQESVKNLLDLVPDRITLSKAELLHNALILHGITPTKDLYQFMLHAPLRSIFNRTYSSFYPMQNGWYSFVSTNYLDEDAI
jgi:hypothetical protein